MSRDLVELWHEPNRSDVAGVSKFAPGRWKYQCGRGWRCTLGITGFPIESEFGGDLDAPGWIAAGGMRNHGRGGWYPLMVHRDAARVS